jgi:NADPH:quinone reductase-like Zn-dependent oxidoreductase
MLRSPINPADLLAIDGRYAFTLDATVPLGAEGVGMVEAVGSRVGRLRPGDFVLPLVRGNWCRFRSLNEDQVVALPPGINLELAATLRINPATARLLLEAAGVSSGQAIVQNGAGSAVAHWVRQFAARRDIAVIDVVRRANSRLPNAIVDGPGLTMKVKAAAGVRPLRAALDCVAGESTDRLADCLEPGGRLLVFGHLSGEPIQVSSQLLTGRQLTISGFSLRPAEAVLGVQRVRATFADIFACVAVASPLPTARTTVALSDIDSAIALAREVGSTRVLLDLTT